MDTQNLIPIAIVKLINISFYIKRILKWQNIVKEICINANSGHNTTSYKQKSWIKSLNRNLSKKQSNITNHNLCPYNTYKQGQPSN